MKRTKEKKGRMKTEMSVSGVMGPSGNALIKAVIMTLFMALVCLLPPQAFANQSASDVYDLDLEDLMGMEITSVSKKPQRLSDAAAAVFVITQEDLRRSGVTNIPDALRMVPGLEVARSSSSQWAVTSRGFNGFLANKLLVLIDGRSVYSPLFSGVYWNQQDTVLEDIDRIEVIRGPGATLWGANAVNGVINVITKNAKDTKGGLLSGGTGTEERGFTSARYGMKLGESTYGRVYGKYFDRGHFSTESDGPNEDAWQAARGGFRIDSTNVMDNSFTLQGDYARGHMQNNYLEPSLLSPYTESFSGECYQKGNILGRWQRGLSDTSDISVQMYYDWTHYSAPSNREIRKTIDVDLQHHFAIDPRHDIIWGAGYRASRGDYKTESLMKIIPAQRTDELFSAFLQDDILLVEDRLHLIVGSKFEHNDYSGFEVQPSIRFLWTPKKAHAFWGAVSRAIRSPSWGEAFGQITGTVIEPSRETLFMPVAANFVGSRGAFDSEKLTAYEAGYRFYPTERFSLDVAAFYNDYSDLRSATLGTPFVILTPVPHIELPMTGSNDMGGKTYGIEITGDWKVTTHLKLQAAYTYLHAILRAKGQAIMVYEEPDASSPHNQFSLRSTFDVTKDVELDGWLRYVDDIASLHVPSYFSLDVRLAWKPLPDMELALIGQNLFNSGHKEFGQNQAWVSSAEVPRGAFIKLAWRFGE
jgi:iron complex outermembrane recepter protein